MKTLMPLGVALLVAALATLIVGCGGGNTVTAPPTLIVQSAPPSGPMVWTDVLVVAGRASVPENFWHRVVADSGRTVSARWDGAGDGNVYEPGSKTFRGNGSGLYTFLIEKGGRTFNISVTVITGN